MLKYYVTILSNFSKGYDKYSNHYSKELIPAKFPDKFFLLDVDQLMVGVDKNYSLLRKNGDKLDQLLILETEVQKGLLYNDHETGIGHYVKRNYINISKCFLYQKGKLVPCSSEEVMAKSLSLQKLLSYSELKPRSVSILPVARGCQASCSFCFSKASVSDDLKGFIKHLDKIDEQLSSAKRNGATRGVITGGGEPTLLDRPVLLNLISRMKYHFSKVVLITNGYVFSLMDLDKRQNVFAELENAGLNVLAISHHHYNEAINKSIMNLDINISGVLNGLVDNQNNITPRLICVLQKNGIETSFDIDCYLKFAAQNKVKQVCFKELYVSTSTESYYHNNDSNIWSRQNQVPLSILISYLESNDFEIIDRLPWGSPVYRGKVDGFEMQIAAYTEPSLFWERTSGVARSWNIMSNGKMLASLEDKLSEVF